MAPKKRLPKNAGFTLLETVVALSLLAIGVLGTLELFPLAMRNQQIAVERSSVASMVRTELGKLRSGAIARQEDFDEFLAEWIVENAYRGPDISGKQLHNGWRASVEAVAGGYDQSVKLYRVTISVDLVGGQNETFVTYLTEY
jgi:prepilin-type N-terminal cleavage/methylation domain-containing protein